MKLKKKNAPKPKTRESNGPREGTISAAWAALFAQNEARVKAGQKGWTDQELMERMQKAFPDSAKKTTITRVSMARACYNKGTNMFASAGPAGKTGRPLASQHGGRAPRSDAGVKRKEAKPAKPAKAAKTKAKAKADKPAAPKLVLKLKKKSSLTTNPKGGVVSVDHGDEA